MFLEVLFWKDTSSNNTGVNFVYLISLIVINGENILLLATGIFKADGSAVQLFEDIYLTR